MGNDGQMILLSALVACLCLFGVVACIAAVDDGAYVDSGHLSDRRDNTRWAQDLALQRAAFYSSTYPWESRVEAALHFKTEANSSLNSLAGELLKHGDVYEFSFNGSLADDYVEAHPENGIVNIDGVLVEPAGGSASICGCAYDMFVCDGVNACRISHVLSFS